MKFRKILILGAGAIGSIYGALLSRKNDVTMIGDKAHVKAINSNGLLITGDLNETFHLKADTRIGDIPEKTLIILTSKAYDLERAVGGISELLKKDTVVLVLQNGLGNEEIVGHIVGDRAQVLRGITRMAAEFFKPGEVKFWNGETIIQNDENGAEIARILNSCGLRAKLSENVEREVWTKLVVNCVVNPLTALFHVRNSAIWVDSLKAVRHGIVNECIAVAEAEGIALPANLAKRIDRRVGTYTNFSSMYQDIVKGKKTEIDFLNGKIVDLGRKHSIPAPINATLTSLIKFLEDRNGVSRKD